MKRLLLAVDGSIASRRGAEFLAHLPHDHAFDLHLISVVRRPIVHRSYATGEMLDKAFRHDCEHARENQASIAEIFDGANIQLHHEICEGDASDVIVRKAKELETDLVVLGATGHSQIGRMLLGSVSDYVATHAPCSVLVIRPPVDDRREGPLRICLGYDASGPSQAALEELMEIPWGARPELHIVSVATFLSDFFNEKESARHYHDDLELAKNQLSKVASKVQTHLLEDAHDGEGLVRFTETHDIDLVVLGETQRTLLSKWLLGSTSRFVLRHTPCSVWITRNRMIKGLRGSVIETPLHAVPPTPLS
ncbi:MAG: universal stress protein [Planctomycetota bacterium]